MSANGNGAAVRRVEYLVVSEDGNGRPTTHACGHRVEYAVESGTSVAGLMTAVLFVRKAAAYNCPWCGGDGTGEETAPPQETFLSPSNHLLPEMLVTRMGG